VATLPLSYGRFEALIWRAPDESLSSRFAMSLVYCSTLLPFYYPRCDLARAGGGGEAAGVLSKGLSEVSPRSRRSLVDAAGHRRRRADGGEVDTSPAERRILRLVVGEATQVLEVELGDRLVCCALSCTERMEPESEGPPREDRVHAAC